MTSNVGGNLLWGWSPGGGAKNSLPPDPYGRTLNGIGQVMYQGQPVNSGYQYPAGWKEPEPTAPGGGAGGAGGGPTGGGGGGPTGRGGGGGTPPAIGGGPTGGGGAKPPPIPPPSPPSPPTPPTGPPTLPPAPSGDPGDALNGLMGGGAAPPTPAVSTPMSNGMMVVNQSSTPAGDMPLAAPGASRPSLGTRRAPALEGLLRANTY